MLDSTSRRLAFNSAILARRRGARASLLVLGDSHTRIFRYIAKQGLLERVRLDWEMVDGATASGLPNAQSVTNAREKFKRRISRAKPWQSLLFMLGEVDCGFVIWYRAQEYGEPVAVQRERALSAYIGFLEEVRETGVTDIAVVSTPLPTIADGQIWGAVSKKRRAVEVSQRDRTDLTLAFNDGLERECLRRGFGYLDVTTGQLDPVTGLIQKRFLNENRFDHHLASGPYAEIVVDRLIQAINETNRPLRWPPATDHSQAQRTSGI